MKPAPFEYRRPETTQEAIDLLAQFGDECKILAGGQSLIPLMNLRFARPAVLIDIGRLAELRTLSRTADGWRIGAMATQATLEAEPGLPPSVASAIPTIAHLQIRTRGTVGGSLVHLDPAAEWPALTLALAASFVIRSRRGTRTIAADQFVAAPYAPALEPDELLVEIRLADQDARQGFAKVSRRPGDFALSGAVIAWPNADGARIAIFGVGPLQQRLPTVERALEQGLRSGAELRTLVGREVEAKSDVHAPAAYRRRLAGILVDRLVASVCA